MSPLLRSPYKQVVPFRVSASQEVFPQNSVLDTFDRADGALGANWVGSFGSDMAIVSNTARALFSVPAGSRWVPGVAFGNDQEAFVTIPVKATPGSTDRGGVWLRSGYGLFYSDQAGDDNYRIYKDINGSEGILANQAGPEFMAGDKIGGSAIGSTITLWHCPLATGVWYKRLEVVDTTHTTGVLGIYSYSDTVRFDDFGGGNVT